MEIKQGFLIGIIILLLGAIIIGLVFNILNEQDTLWMETSVQMPPEDRAFIGLWIDGQGRVIPAAVLRLNGLYLDYSNGDAVYVMFERPPILWTKLPKTGY